jgi:cytochrome c553
VRNATNPQRRLWRLFAATVSAAALGVAAHADEGTESKSAQHFDVKNTFRNICGFCHEDYGRHTGKGPQLMDNPNSDEFLFKRIKDGKPGRMAAFGSVFSDEQIHQIVVFIRNLKPGVEPQNP